MSVSSFANSSQEMSQQDLGFLDSLGQSVDNGIDRLSNQTIENPNVWATLVGSYMAGKYLIVGKEMLSDVQYKTLRDLGKYPTILNYKDIEKITKFTSKTGVTRDIRIDFVKKSEKQLLKMKASDLTEYKSGGVKYLKGKTLKATADIEKILLEMKDRNVRVYEVYGRTFVPSKKKATKNILMITFVVGMYGYDFISELLE